jgi:hypothetical protein
VRRLVPVALLGSLALAGCGSSGNAASDNPTVTSAPPAPATTSAAPTSAAPTSAAATSAAGPARCHTADLRAGLGDHQGAAGHLFQVVTLTNTGTAACRIFGFPGMALQDASKNAMTTTVVRNGGQLPSTAPGSVALAPGGVASFTVSWSDVPTGSATNCPTSASALVTPPDETDALTVALQATACGGELDVSPVVIGSGGVSA